MHQFIITVYVYEYIRQFQYGIDTSLQGSVKVQFLENQIETVLDYRNFQLRKSHCRKRPLINLVIGTSHVISRK